MPDLEVVETTEELVQRCRRGDLCAFTRLFRRFQDRLYDLACAILHNEADAEDAVQDTFLRVFRDIARYRHESSFETWLVAVTVNVCRDRLRRRRVRQALSLELLGPRQLVDNLRQGADPAAQVLQEERRHSVWALADRLDERYRLPLILRHYYGLSCGEVAEVLHLSSGTVYAYLSEGRRRVREMLESQEDQATRTETGREPC